MYIKKFLTKFRHVISLDLKTLPDTYCFTNTFAHLSVLDNSIIINKSDEKYVLSYQNLYYHERTSI